MYNYTILPGLNTLFILMIFSQSDKFTKQFNTKIEALNAIGLLKLDMRVEDKQYVIDSFLEDTQKINLDLYEWAA